MHLSVQALPAKRDEPKRNSDKPQQSLFVCQIFRKAPNGRPDLDLGKVKKFCNLFLILSIKVSRCCGWEKLNVTKKEIIRGHLYFHIL